MLAQPPASYSQCLAAQLHRPIIASVSTHFIARCRSLASLTFLLLLAKLGHQGRPRVAPCMCCGQRLRISLQRCSSERTSFRAHPLPPCWLAARQTARSPVMAAAPVLAHPLAPCLQCLAAQRHRPIVASVPTLSPDASYVPPHLHFCFCWQSSAIRDALGVAPCMRCGQRLRISAVHLA
jgi:hypothetical protein